ncbi:hypothetical protein Tco_0651302, partial [Tanacetum coccineum]
DGDDGISAGDDVGDIHLVRYGLDGGDNGGDDNGDGDGDGDDDVATH